MPLTLPLLPGIKRRTARKDDARSDVADAALRAKRPGVLSRYRMTCAGCGYIAKTESHLDVHHLDDDHHNNAEANLVAACKTCHPYQHIGEGSKRTDIWAEGLGKQTLLAFLPEISASDASLLQRAIGAALLDESSKADAIEILEELLNRDKATKAVFGSCRAKDFARAMVELTDEQYRSREQALKDYRLMFSEALLHRLGREFVADYPTQPVTFWPQIASGVAPRRKD